ncbi:MAG: S24 family peptidase [Gammaproteobacteria bacterium]|nr:S24 family peptidase [Gammaproteobacteria bacterium]
MPVYGQSSKSKPVHEITQCSASEPFALRVIGDDMAPEFSDGNIIIVDPGGLVRSGCFVVVRINGDVLLRQLQIVNDQYHLNALRKGVTESSLGSADSIVGVVSQRTGRRRSEMKRYDC